MSPIIYKVCLNGFLLLMIIADISCKTTQTEQKDNQKSITSPGISSPDRGRIEAKVIKILPITKEDSGTVCAKAPCHATIKVNKIGSYGRSFSKSFEPGDEIEVMFVYTLNPTSKDLFPDLKYLYPGLKECDTFTGEIQSRIRPGRPPSYYIYHYELKK